MDILRFATAGSVDDGKSTLIGRLLYDTSALPEDQLDALERTGRRVGDRPDLALLTDGLRAEREQGITIDVAYRYFQTSRRKFVIADTPGHVQYTRNMATGASTADLAVVLVDARRGVLQQSRRHAFLASLLGVPHLVLAVNKMDLVDFSEDVYERIRTDFLAFTDRLRVSEVTTIPMCATDGDNVVRRSARMPWYEGPPLLHHLEHVHVASDRNLIDLRFPVQLVLRPDGGPPAGDGFGRRWYAGQVASGVLRRDQEIMALPSGLTSRVVEIRTASGPVDAAYPPLSVAVRLADEIDVSRGDMLCRPNNQPAVSQEIEAMLCWMEQRPLAVGEKLLLKHTTRTVPAVLRELRYRIDVDTLHSGPADALALNDIGRVRLRSTQPLFCDDYARNRTVGSFVLIDPRTSATVAAGTIAAARP